MAGITPVRNDDWLLTPDNAVIAFIDYQPDQYAGLGSMPVDELLVNVTTLGQIATAFELPVVLSTVAMKLRGMEGTNQELHAALNHAPQIDRTTLNSWEDEEFRNAVAATGRRNIVMAGLWTEVCLTFPTIDMQAEGYHVYPVADAVGGISPVAHDRAIERMQAAGATPITAIQFGSELMRNWARDSSQKFREVLKWYFPKRFALLKEGKI